MHDRNWERVAGLAGLSAVILFVVPTFVGTGTMPKPSDPDSTYKAYLVNHHAAVIRYVWLGSLAAVLVLWLGSGIRSYLKRHGEEDAGSTVFALFVAATVLLGISYAITGGLAYRVLNSTAPGTVRLLTDVTMAMTTTVLGLVTTVAASLIAVAAFTSRSIPRAVGITSVAAAAVNLAGSLTVFTTRGFFSLEGAFGFVGLAVTMIWVISLSVALMRPAEAAATAPVATAVSAG